MPPKYPYPVSYPLMVFVTNNRLGWKCLLIAQLDNVKLGPEAIDVWAKPSPKMLITKSLKIPMIILRAFLLCSSVFVWMLLCGLLFALT